MNFSVFSQKDFMRLLHHEKPANPGDSPKKAARALVSHLDTASQSGTPPRDKVMRDTVSVQGAQLENIARRLRAHLDIRDRTTFGGLKTYRQCFSGNSAVVWLIRNKVASDAMDAILICNALLRIGSIVPVEEISEQIQGLIPFSLDKGSAEQFRNSDTALYRFGSAPKRVPTGPSAGIHRSHNFPGGDASASLHSTQARSSSTGDICGASKLNSKQHRVECLRSSSSHFLATHHGHNKKSYNQTEKDIPTPEKATSSPSTPKSSASTARGTERRRSEEFGWSAQTNPTKEVSSDVNNANNHNNNDLNNKNNKNNNNKNLEDVGKLSSDAVKDVKSTPMRTPDSKLCVNEEDQQSLSETKLSKTALVRWVALTGIEAASRCTVALGWPMAVQILCTISLVTLLCSVSRWPVYSWLVLAPLAMVYMHSVEQHYTRKIRAELTNQVWRYVLNATMSRDDAEHCRWFNRLLAAMWVGWIEPWLNRLIKRALTNNLAKLNPPVLSALRLTEFKLGSAAPFFKTVRVYSGASDHETKLEVDLDLHTKNLQVVVSATLAKLGVPVSLHLCDIKVSGRLRLGFKYLPHAPYIKSLSVGFVSMPDYHLSLKPLSQQALNVTDLPVFNSWLKSLTDTLLDRFLVEPNPFLWQVERWWWGNHRCSHLCIHREPAGAVRNQAIPPAADTRPRDGPVAWIEIVIVEGVGLMKPFQGLGHIAPYCRVFQGGVKRANTPGVQSCVWRQPFSFPVRNWGQDSRLLIQLRDKSMVGEKHSLGHCEVDARNYLDGSVHSLSVKLSKATSGSLSLKIMVVAPAWDSVTHSFVPAVCVSTGPAFSLEFHQRRSLILEALQLSSPSLNRRQQPFPPVAADQQQHGGGGGGDEAGEAEGSGVLPGGMNDNLQEYPPGDPKLRRASAAGDFEVGWSGSNLADQHHHHHQRDNKNTSTTGLPPLAPHPSARGANTDHSTSIRTESPKKFSSPSHTSSHHPPPLIQIPREANPEDRQDPVRTLPFNSDGEAEAVGVGGRESDQRPLETSAFPDDHKEQEEGTEETDDFFSPGPAMLQKLRSTLSTPWSDKVKAGWLTKRSRNRSHSFQTWGISNWKRRFFVLDLQPELAQLSVRYYKDSHCSAEGLKGEMMLSIKSCTRIPTTAAEMKLLNISDNAVRSNKVYFAILRNGASDFTKFPHKTVDIAPPPPPPPECYKDALVLISESVEDRADWVRAIEDKLRSLRARLLEMDPLVLESVRKGIEMPTCSNLSDFSGSETDSRSSTPMR